MRSLDIGGELKEFDLFLTPLVALVSGDYFTRNTGAGVGVAVLDTGIADVAEIRGKVKYPTA